MKKVILFVLVCLVLLFIANYGRTIFRSKIESALSTQPEETLMTPHPTPTVPAAQTINETLFIPYWSITNNFVSPPYQKLVYFGVQASPQGIDTSDKGYLNLPVFAEGVTSQNTILAIRMIDSTSNFSILKNKSAQSKLIMQSIQLAQKYHFKGILLDLEVTALPFTSLVNQISSFNTDFAIATRKANLSYSITAYGDSFYRVRPFDINKMAKDSDEVYIMAYDFHKANGNPGPNFPLGGSDVYGYDYAHMIDNFADAVPLKKLIIIFGMYGYDWQVDDKAAAKGPGSAISLKDINASIITSCQHQSCEWERDRLSGETKVTYRDDSNDKHIVWFEDNESVKRKQEFLKKRGIGSYAYWAYSYF